MDMNPGKAILQVDDVRYSYHNSIPALCGVTLQIPEREIFAIIGSNGCGKSTLLHVMDGLIHPSSGKVSFKGLEISEKSLGENGLLRYFRSEVGYIFQDSDVQLFCPTVTEELMFGPLQIGLSEKEARDRSADILQMLEIGHLAERPSYMLSAGEKKRVAIGSILTINPELLLLDEPTNGLDPRTQCYLVELILTLNAAGKTIVIATHDLSLVSELQCRVGVLSEDHKIEKTGKAEEILYDTDLLLKVNLIHEHMHYHGTTLHRHIHSHYLIHKHNGGQGGRKDGS